MVQHLNSLAPGRFVVRVLDLGVEDYTEPYNGGTELFACGGGSRKPSEKPKTEAGLDGQPRGLLLVPC